MAFERVFIAPLLRPVGEVRMIAESVQGELVGETSSGIVAQSIRNAVRFSAARRVTTEVGRRERGTRQRFVTIMAEILLGASILSIGLKFASYWDHWVFFPTIPNLLDSLVLAIAGALLLSRGIRGWYSEVWTSRKPDEAALSPATSLILMVAITVGLAILLYFMVLWTTPGH